MSLLDQGLDEGHVLDTLFFMKASRAPKPQPAKKIPRGDRKTATKGTTACPRVRTAVLPGGYRVFGAPVEPQHTTRERIAEAVAAVHLA
jgi:hypothetical protein